MGAPVTVQAYNNKGTIWDFGGGVVYSAVSTASAYPTCGVAAPYRVVALDFGWPSLPTGAQVITATLYVRFYQGLPTYNDSSGTVDIGVTEVSAAWTEGQASAPSLGSSLGNFPTGTGVNESWLSLDITTPVRTKYNGGTFYGVFWGNNDLRDNAVFFEGYGDATYKAYVDITYHIPGGYSMML